MPSKPDKVVNGLATRRTICLTAMAAETAARWRVPPSTFKVLGRDQITGYMKLLRGLSARSESPSRSGGSLWTEDAGLPARTDRPAVCQN